MEQVILVDKDDTPIGTMEKQEAHEKALLHRAFSIFLFNEKGETLLQKRWQGKYHSGGLWTNSCCGHPRPGEENVVAAQRRLAEELGVSAPLTEGFTFYYKAPFDNGLTEHEFVHVFSGSYEGPFDPHPEEVEDLKWITLEALKEDVTQRPDAYTAWFKLYLEQKWEELQTLIHPRQV